VPYLTQVIDIGRTYLVEGYAGFFQEQIGLLWSNLKEDLDHWHGPFNTPEGRPYYVNSVTNLSSWEDPRIDAQYIFELQNSLLNSLEQLLPPPTKVPRFGCDSPTAKGRGNIPRPWLDQGAEIFTLDDGNPGDERPDTGAYARSQTPPRSGARRMTASQRLIEEVSPKQHLAELQDAMSDIGTRQKLIEDSIQDQEEVQRLRLRHRVEQRRQRQRSQTPTPSRGSAPSSAPQSPSNGKKFRPPPLLSDANGDAPSGDKNLAGGQISRLQLPTADPGVPNPPPLPGEGEVGQYFAPIPSPKGIRTPGGDRSRMAAGGWMSPKLKKMTGKELTPEDKYHVQERNPRGSFSSVPLSPCNAGLVAPPGATAEEARMLGMEEQKQVEVTPRRGAAQNNTSSDGKDTLLKRPGVAMGKSDSIQRVDSNPSIEDAEDPLGATLR
jgi:hypothetical protein